MVRCKSNSFKNQLAFKNNIRSQFTDLIPDNTYTHLFHPCQLGDHFIAIALIYQKSLPFLGVMHLLSILRHQRIEKCVILLRNRSCKKGKESVEQIGRPIHKRI